VVAWRCAWTGKPGMTNVPVHVGWGDIAEVVLFHRTVPGERQPSIGLRRRPGTPSPATTFKPRSRSWASNRKLMRHVPEDVLLLSRPVSGWRLDERRLLEAVDRYAPGVRVVRLDETGAVHPLDSDDIASL
jgi:hypothetical protein